MRDGREQEGMRAMTERKRPSAVGRAADQRAYNLLHHGDSELDRLDGSEADATDPLLAEARKQTGLFREILAEVKGLRKDVRRYS